ncbi:MAG TPA: hypothetical protein VG963_32950, partial [Polyangiaceae bacterium]|nr:hypothetical protein [Polyangiaceae bacterium]
MGPRTQPRSVAVGAAISSQRSAGLLGLPCWVGCWLLSACVSTGDPLFHEVASPTDEGSAGASAGAARLPSMDDTAEMSAVAILPSETDSPEKQNDVVPVGVSPAAVSQGATSQDTSSGAAQVGGSGGAASSLGQPSPVSAPAAVDPCPASGNFLLCDSFEASAAGSFPQGAGWLPELSSCGTHVVDASGPSVSGTHALRADAGGYPECMLHADVSGENDLYVRTHVLLGPGTELGQYLSLLEFGARASQDDPELRVGLRAPGDGTCADAPGLDVSGSGLSGGAKTACSGLALEQQRWYCLEAHLARNDRQLSVSVSVDGASAVDASFTGTNAWAAPDLFVKLGRADYGKNGQGSVWHDDVAISRAP